MPALQDKEPRVRVAVSMRRSQHEALREQALSERHGNLSLIVQRAIDKELGLTDTPIADEKKVAVAA